MNMQKEIDLSQTSGVICQNCSCPFFKQVLLVRKVSRFITGEAEDITMPLAVLVCDSCGVICSDALQPQVKAMLVKEQQEAVQEDNNVVAEPTTGAKIIKMETK